MFVDEDDAVRALERRAGRTDVDARRVGAVLAHHRDLALGSVLRIAQRHFANPLCVGFGVAGRPPAILVAAGFHTEIASGGALVQIDQERPSSGRGRRLIRRSRARFLRAESIKRHARSEQSREQTARAFEECPALGFAASLVEGGAHGLASRR